MKTDLTTEYKEGQKLYAKNKYGDEMIECIVEKVTKRQVRIYHHFSILFSINDERLKGYFTTERGYLAHTINRLKGQSEHYQKLALNLDSKRETLMKQLIALDEKEEKSETNSA